MRLTELIMDAFWYSYAVGYMGATKPDAALPENVLGVLALAKGASISDADWIKSNHEDNYGYCAAVTTHEAAQGGSLCRRGRVFFQNLLKSKGGSRRKIEQWTSLAKEVRAAPPAWTAIFGDNFEAFDVIQSQQEPNEKPEFCNWS